MVNQSIQTYIQKQYDEFDYEYISLTVEHHLCVGKYKDISTTYTVDSKPVGGEKNIKIYSHVGQVISHIKTLTNVYNNDNYEVNDK